MPVEARGLGVEAGDFVSNEVPTPAPDAAETEFTTGSPYEAGTLQVFRDQLTLQGGGVDFTETTPGTGLFTVTSAPDADEVIWCRYIKA